MRYLVSKGRKGLGKDEKGQALVEFTLTAPLIILVLIGVVFFAWVMYDFVVLQHAVREGAHYYITHPQATEDEVVAVVKNNVGFLDPNAVNVLIEGALVTGGWVEVTAYYTIRITEVTVPYIIAPGSYTFPPISIRAVSSMYLD